MVTQPKPNDFQDLLLRRGVFYTFPSGVGDFVRYYLGTKPTVTKQFSTDDSVIALLRKFLDEQHVKFSDQDLQANDAWPGWQIKREVFTTLYGLNEGYKVALDNDAQLNKAVEEGKFLAG